MLSGSNGGKGGKPLRGMIFNVVMAVAPSAHAIGCGALVGAVSSALVGMAVF